MDFDERLQAISRDIEMLTSMQAANERRFEQVTHNFEIVLDSIQRLERISVAHEDRIDRFENE